MIDIVVIFVPHHHLPISLDIYRDRDRDLGLHKVSGKLAKHNGRLPPILAPHGGTLNPDGLWDAWIDRR